MDVFLVYDTKGAGRFVGVFDDEARARRVADVNPGYYRVSRVPVNAINPEAPGWMEDGARRKELEQLMLNRKS